MTEPSTNTDPRIEAGAKAWDKHMGGRYSPHEVEELSEEVAVILAAADAVDPRKPTILGYVTVGRDGWTIGGHYPTRKEAQAQADEWNKDAKSTGVDWDYRVAEIVEATK